jgi:hypothetical protein
MVLIAALLVGCSKKEDPGPPCDKVVDRMLELTKQMVPGHDMGALGDRKQMVAQCEQRKMPAAVRKCIVDAKSTDELSKCREPTPTPEPTTTRPLPTGSAARSGS